MALVVLGSPCATPQLVARGSGRGELFLHCAMICYMVLTQRGNSYCTMPQSDGTAFHRAGLSLCWTVPQLSGGEKQHCACLSLIWAGLFWPCHLKILLTFNLHSTKKSTFFWGKFIPVSQRCMNSCTGGSYIKIRMGWGLYRKALLELHVHSKLWAHCHASMGSGWSHCFSVALEPKVFRVEKGGMSLPQCLPCSCGAAQKSCLQPQPALACQ